MYKNYHVSEVIIMPNWLKDAVFYEIYPQTFCDSNGDGIGDINGIISKLDYVQSLGCNAIWLNPVYDSPFMDAGYDVRNYYQVAERYGTNEDLKRLFEIAHEKGIRILLDLVPGHTSERMNSAADISGQTAFGKRRRSTDCYAALRPVTATIWSTISAPSLR